MAPAWRDRHGLRFSHWPMYEMGWGVPQNLERAQQLYARAAGNSNAVANLGRDYFDSVPASMSPERTPQRSVASSSEDSSAFWGVVVLGVLAVGAASMLSSHGSNSGSPTDFSGSIPDAPKWDPDYGKHCTVQVDNWGIVDTKPVFCV
jgi:TPR repeat protein